MPNTEQDLPVTGKQPEDNPRPMRPRADLTSGERPSRTRAPSARDLLYDKDCHKQFIQTKNGNTFYIVDYDKPVDEDGNSIRPISQPCGRRDLMD